MAALATLLLVAGLIAVPIQSTAQRTESTGGGWTSGRWTTTDPVRWIRLGVVLDLGPPGSYDSAGAMNPFVLNDEGTFRMWYRGFDGTHNRILDAISSDGVSWTRRGLVFDVDSPPYYFDSVAGQSVLKEGGLYRMWFGAGYWTGPFGMIGKIYLAESPDAVIWTVHGAALDEGPSGAWDGVLVGYPMVTRDGSGRYLMYYGGWDGYTIRVGVATSPDGVRFDRMGTDPALSMGVPGAWDGDHVNEPFVLPGSTWEMRFMGFDGTTQRIGLALSSDGVTWTKSPDNPEFTEGDPGSWDDAGVWGESLLLDGSDLQLYYSGSDGSANRIGLAKLAQPTPPGNVDCDPDTLNLRSRGRWITCYLEPESGRSASEILAVSVRLDSWLAPVLEAQHGFAFDPSGYLVDHDGDGILERLLKFDRWKLAGSLTPGGHTFLIDGRYSDGTAFAVLSETIRVIP